mmetsp:Transcript_3968/g.11517  ORF Transcript_3968/g.11517 Transcript_3968/m.11517 type:complete len:123 (-) Transcript_3968:330-698(-)
MDPTHAPSIEEYEQPPQLADPAPPRMQHRKNPTVRLHKETAETMDKILGNQWTASDVSLAIEYFGALLEKDENVLNHFRSHVAKLNYKKRVKAQRRKEREERRRKRREEETANVADTAPQTI